MRGTERILCYSAGKSGEGADADQGVSKDVKKKSKSPVMPLKSFKDDALPKGEGLTRMEFQPPCIVQNHPLSPVFFVALHILSLQ